MLENTFLKRGRNLRETENTLLLFSHSVVSDSLRHCGLQHARLLRPSPSPGACSNSCSLSWWCYPTISSSVIPFSCFYLSQHHSLFQWISPSHQVPKVLELQLQYLSFQWIFRVDFLLDWLVWSPYSPRDSQESSPTPQFKSINSLALSFLFGPTLTSIHDSGKTIALAIRTFVGNVSAF